MRAQVRGRRGATESGSMPALRGTVPGMPELRGPTCRLTDEQLLDLQVHTVREE